MSIVRVRRSWLRSVMAHANIVTGISRSAPCKGYVPTSLSGHAAEIRRISQRTTWKGEWNRTETNLAPQNARGRRRCDRNRTGQSHTARNAGRQHTMLGQSSAKPRTHYGYSECVCQEDSRLAPKIAPPFLNSFSRGVGAKGRQCCCRPLLCVLESS